MTHVQFRLSPVLVCPAQMVTADRYIIANRTEAALRAQADGKPLELVFMSADAANQTQHSLPSLYPPTHGGDRCVCFVSTLSLLHEFGANEGGPRQKTKNNARGASKCMHIHALTQSQ